MYTAGLKTKSSAFYSRCVHVCFQYSTIFPYTTFIPDPWERWEGQCFHVIFPVFKLFSSNWTLAYICKYGYPLYRILRNLWFIVYIYGYRKMQLMNISTLQPEKARRSHKQIHQVLKSLSRREITSGVIWFLSCSSWLSGELLVSFDIRMAFKTSPETTIWVCTSQRTQRAYIMRINQWML
jgi:hypothetical protein